MTHFYKAFGLVWQSDFSIRQWRNIECDETIPDVVIRLDEVSKDGLETIEDANRFWQAASGKLWLFFPGIARFLIENGNEIIVEPVHNNDDSVWGIYLLGSALGALLLQRRGLVLHANSFIKDGRAFLICGNSGLGKSSLNTELYARGYTVLSDDQSLIDSNDEVHSGHQYLKLWQETIDYFQLGSQDKFPVREGLEKYYIPIKPVTTGSYPLGGLYILEAKSGVQASISKITGSEKFGYIRDNIYRKRYLPGMGVNDVFMRRVFELSARVSVYRLHRPFQCNSIKSLCDLIETKSA